MKTGATDREAYRKKLLRQMERLARGRVNDAVKLAFLDGERTGEIDRLDLSPLTEFKRSANGAVEIKLTDRLAVLEKLLDQAGDGKRDQAEAFFRALEGEAGIHPAAPAEGTAGDGA